MWCVAVSWVCPGPVGLAHIAWYVSSSAETTKLSTIYCICSVQSLCYLSIHSMHLTTYTLLIYIHNYIIVQDHVYMYTVWVGEYRIERADLLMLVGRGVSRRTRSRDRRWSIAPLSGTHPLHISISSSHSCVYLKTHLSTIHCVLMYVMYVCLSPLNE